MKNVNIEAIKTFVESGRKDTNQFRKLMKVEVKWNADESKPQMSSVLETPQGQFKIDIDSPPFMGGKGASVSPVQLCLVGMLSCFIGTFASICAEEGIEVEELSGIIENNINLERTFGISNAPITEKIKIILNVKGKGDIQKAKKLAMERCPAIFCITNPIPVDIEVRNS